MISRMLNYCEAVAVAIENGVISEAIYSDWNRTQYVDIWNKTGAYIQAKRDRGGQPTAQEHFQRVVERWKEEDEQT